MSLIFNGITDIGCVRKSNQDSIYLNKSQNLFVVADGMGGHKGGDIASAMAVEIIPQTFSSQQEETPIKNKIINSICAANNAIIHRGAGDEKLKGMGTTTVLAYFHDSHLYVGNVGDSRCYLISDNHLYQLTSDHSLIQEKLNLSLLSGIYNYDREAAKNDPQGNVITRTVGFEENLEVDVFKYKVKKKDLFILCSDGLHGKVEDQKIFELCQSITPCESREQSTIKKCTESLVQEAKSNGGNDNISVITIAAV